jgi:Wax ester synthase/diacylglycerol acyltransferase catalytic domain/WS/DGAT C-terminal domain
VPRFQQLLYVPGPGLGRAVWVDAPVFDLADHVQAVPVPGPGDEAALLRAAEQLRRRRLDRSRPLWQMWLLPGLPDGRVGLFVKIHHVIADASAGVAALGGLLDTSPDAPPGWRCRGHRHRPDGPRTDLPAPGPAAGSSPREPDRADDRPAARRGARSRPQAQADRHRDRPAEGANPPLGGHRAPRPDARRAVLAAATHQHLNLASADVPGPPQPLYLAGARLLEVFPVLPLMPKTTLGVGALSYAAQFTIMAVADQDACPDLGLFAVARDELRALATATRATPGHHEQC